MSDKVTAVIRGATSGIGHATGRHYRVGAGETLRLENVPRRELDTFPDDRVGVVGDEGTGRSWEANGSWKTLYDNGEEVDKVLCSPDEADAWADGDLDLSDLQ